MEIWSIVFLSVCSVFLLDDGNEAVVLWKRKEFVGLLEKGEKSSEGGSLVEDSKGVK